MTPNWPQMPITDVAEMIDCVNRTAPTVPGPTPFRMIRTTNVKGGRLELTETKYATEDVYRRWTRRGAPQIGDVLLTREAPLGEVAMVKTRDQSFLGQRIVQYRAHPATLDARFLLYSLLGDEFRAQVHGAGSGATVEHARLEDCRKFLIRVPPLPVQRKIATILSTYDDLIENNNHRIAILEEMARMIYQEWFTHFRFPAHDRTTLTESRQGSIPSGWRLVKLEEVAAVNARSIKPGAEPDVIRYVDIASVAPGCPIESREMSFNEAPGRARRLVNHGDIVWSSVRPNLKSFFLVLNPPTNLVVSTGFAVIEPRDCPFSFLYCALTTEDFIGYLVNRARGSAYPAVTGRDFEDADILLPPAPLLQSFHQIVADHLLQKQHLRQINENLRTTRDLLLPRLLSGEIDTSQLDIDTGEMAA